MNDYVCYYNALHHKEEPTTILGWIDGVLMQKWKISETRDIYCDEAKRDYSHTEPYREEVWRVIPVYVLTSDSKKETIKP
jgi:hypothetical protein